MKVVEMGQRLLFLALGLVSLLAISACGSGGGGGGGIPPATAQTGTVSGQVASASNGSAVAGATVSTSAGTSTTAANGTFTVPAPVGDRSVVHVEATGFAEAFPVSRVTAGQTTTVGVRLLPTAVSKVVTVANGDIVTDPNSTAQVNLPIDGLVPKNGGAAASTVTVSLTPINPAVDTNLMPGDFTGVSAGGGSPVPIESFGALLIDIRDSAGTRYTLAPGKTSTIRIPLGTKSLTPPQTVPLWFFDETTGLWKEEGTATLAGTLPNQYYEGIVTHFSAWNADQVSLRTFVSGCVKDTNGNPVAGVTVESNGIDYTGSASGVTAADGTFKVGVRKGSSATISVIEWNLFSFVLTTLSNTVTVAPSDVDRTLSPCLVMLPGAVRITTQALPSGPVGLLYNTTVAALNGTQPYSWDVSIGSLPIGLTLNPSTGEISGTPTTVGVSTFTIRVQDNSGPPQSATKQFTIAIIQVNSGGGDGALTVTGAPASVGGTFVADGKFTAQSVSGNFASVAWIEGFNGNFTHIEEVVVSFDIITNQIQSVIFVSADSSVSTGWICTGFVLQGFPTCSGTVNRTTGTLTLTNSVLTDTVTSSPTITLNGTLNFTPF